jgi:DNA end-binding protein Ku
VPPHALGSVTISFGLVSIPVRLYSATRSLAPSFHLVHAQCGGRIRQQIFCPTCQRVVERTELVRGYEVASDRHVTFTPEELKALESATTHTVDIRTFVPLASVDPIYFEGTYYLGTEPRSDKPYRLLVEAMAETEQAAVAVTVMRGKENPVLIRAARRGLMLHTLFFPDEVRDFDEIPKGDTETVKPQELDLARRLVSELAEPAFQPAALEDTYRHRVEQAAQAKLEGKQVTEVPVAPTAQIIDLMEALRQSLERKASTRVAARVEETSGSAPKRQRGRKTG